jgi:hypothetical protein
VPPVKQIEAAFKTLKSELGLRPIDHQVEKRAEAHIFVAFLAYALSLTLRQRPVALAPGLTPRAVQENLAPIQMLDVCFPTAGGRWLIMPRYTQPEPGQMLLLHQLHLPLPSQPPPRIKASDQDSAVTLNWRMHPNLSASQSCASPPERIHAPRARCRANPSLISERLLFDQSRSTDGRPVFRPSRRASRQETSLFAYGDAVRE